MRKVVFAAGLALVAACNTPFDNNLPPGSLEGAWVGSMSSAGNNVGALHLSLVALTAYAAQTPGGLGGWTMGGDWSVAAPSVADSGTVSASGTDGAINLEFDLKGTGACAIVLIGEQRGSSTIAGVYTATSCAVPDSGAFTVSRP